MAYQAKRSKKYVEDLELVDEDGNVKHTLHISLDADDMAVKINRKYTALTRALSETTEAKEKLKQRKNYKAYSRCLVMLWLIYCKQYSEKRTPRFF